MSNPITPANAEQAVLGCMMIERRAVGRALHLLAWEDFVSPAGQTVFEAIRAYLESTPDGEVDLVTVGEQLRRMKKLDGVGGMAFLTECVHAPATAAHVESYCRFVKDSSLERQIDRQLTITAEERTSDNHKRLGDLILSLQGNRGGSIFDTRKDLGPLIEELLEKPEPGLKTGLPGLDSVIGPIRPGNLWTIGARPGGGKSALMLKIMAMMAQQQTPVEVLYLTTEMTVKEMVQRLLPMATGIPHARFRRAQFSPNDINTIYEACEGLSGLPIRIMGRPRLSLDDIRGAVFQVRPQVVFIDYLQRCRLPRAENMAYQIAEFYAELKSFLLEVGVAAFIGAQTDREVDKNPTIPPTMSHLKGSGGIESESDGVGLLWEPPQQVIEKRSGWIPPSPYCTPIEMYVRKNRNGPKDVVADLELDGRLINMCERQAPVPQQGELTA